MASTSAQRVTNLLRVYLLGAFRLERETQTLRLPTRKVESLLAFLILHPQVHSREKLASLLWGDTTDENARASLRVALNNLRKSLGDEIVLTDRDTVQLNPDCPMWVDVKELRDWRLEIDIASNLQSLTSLYQDALLPDFYDDWILPEREHLRQVYLDNLLDATQSLRVQGEYERAIELAKGVLVHDAANEIAHQQIMFCNVALGNRHAALEQYTQCERALATELAVKPSPETNALYEWVRQTPLEQRSPAARLTNLPIPLTSFIGRQNEIAQVKEMLATSRLLTLTGSGGCGKTRLAIQVATELVVSSTFKDGVWWVNLASLADGALLPQTVAQVLNVHQIPNQSLSETLAEYLCGKNLLLVLDNCEHLIAVCAQLASILLNVCSALKIFATSREALGITGEVAWRVPSLALADPRHLPPLEQLQTLESIRLFNTRAQAVNSDFALDARNALAVTQVCHRLDGIPLAIELAAALAKVLTAQQIAARLDDRFNLLTVGSRAAVPRQQTLRATIQWSYDLLTEQERTMLRRLSVFAGGFSLQAVEKILTEALGSQGAEEHMSPLPPNVPVPLLDLLSRLVDKSLVVTEERDGAMRYRLLETLLQYGTEKLRKANELETMRHRHALYFAELAEQAEKGLRGVEMRAWLERLEIEHDNFRAALEWSLEHESPETCLRFADGLGLFWYKRAYTSEGRIWLERILGKSADAPEPLRAKAMVSLSWLLRRLGDYRRLIELSEHALIVFRQAGDKLRMVDALNVRGNVGMYQNELPRALACFIESLSLCDEMCYQWGRVLPLIYLAQVAAFGLQWNVKAKARCEEGLELAQAMDDLTEQANAHLVLGLGARLENDYARAQAHFEQTVALSQQSGDRSRLAWGTVLLGATMLWQAQVAEALPIEQSGLQMALDLGEKTATVHAFSLIAQMIGCQGQTVRAARLLGFAEAWGESFGHRFNPLMDLVSERYINLIRAQLDDVAFTQTKQEGAAMSLERAIADALGK